MLAKLCTRSAVRRCAGTGVLALALLGSVLPTPAAAAFRLLGHLQSNEQGRLPRQPAETEI